MLSAFKNFMLTFLIAAVLFGVVGFFTTKYVGDIITGIIDGEEDFSGTVMSPPTESEEDEPDEPKIDPDQKVPEGESFTILVVGTDYRPDMYKNYYVTTDDYLKVIEDFAKSSGNKDIAGLKDKNKKKDPVSVLSTDVRRISATWLALVRADKENREYAVCYFSPETHVSAPCGDSTLGEVYGLYGIDVVCQYMNALTGLDVDYSFVIDGVNAEAFVNSMGAVTFNLSTDLFAGKNYHLSSSTTIIGGEEDEEETDEKSEGTDKSDELDESKDSDKNENKDDGKESGKNNGGTVVENIPVLKKGKQSLSSYSVNIVNTFKELSQSDVESKSSYILEMVEQYLKRCAAWSEGDLTVKVTSLTTFDGHYDLYDPYANKAVLATEFTAEDVKGFHSMLEAIEYFEYKEFTYPGAYSDKKDVYEPDIKTGLDIFKNYRSEKENSNNQEAIN